MSQRSRSTTSIGSTAGATRDRELYRACDISRCSWSRTRSSSSCRPTFCCASFSQSEVRGGADGCACPPSQTTRLRAPFSLCLSRRLSFPVGKFLFPLFEWLNTLVHQPLHADASP